MLLECWTTSLVVFRLSFQSSNSVEGASAFHPFVVDKKEVYQLNVRDEAIEVLLLQNC